MIWVTQAFFVTLEEIAIFLYIKAVWRIEEKWGYDLETVLNSTFCYKLHSMRSNFVRFACRRTLDFEPSAVYDSLSGAKV